MQAAQEQLATQQITPSISVESTSKLLTRAQQKAAFFEYRKAGIAKLRSAELVGVSTTTGTRWEKERIGIDAPKNGQISILAKDRLAAKLSQDILDASVPAQHRATSGTLLAKLQGYISKEEASDPTQPRKPLRELVLNWFNERNNAQSRTELSAPTANNPQVDITAVIGPCIYGAQPAAAEARPGSPQASGDEVVQAISPPAAEIPEGGSTT